MQEVTPRFLEALGKPHRRVTTATVTLPGEQPQQLRIKAGSVTVASRRTARRQFTGTFFGGADVYALLSTDGAELSVSHGLRLGNTSELLPVFTGEILKARQPFGQGETAVIAHDYGHWLNEARFVSPWSAVGEPNRPDAIATLVAEGRPGTVIVDQATSGGTVGDAVWDRSRTEAISDIARDGNLDAFFLPDGSYLIRDAKTPTSPSDYTIRGGPGGTLKSGSRLRPFDHRYNAVVVAPSSPTQEWAEQVAVIADSSNPRHPDRIGLRPYFMSLPTVLTADEAASVAAHNLARLSGNTETLTFASVSNPACEAGDVIRVVVPAVNGEPAVIFQHYLDSFSIDLPSGAMVAETLAQRVTDE